MCTGGWSEAAERGDCGIRVSSGGVHLESVALK